MSPPTAILPHPPETFVVSHQADGFSLMLICQVLSPELTHELQAVPAQGQSAGTPATNHLAMLDRLTKAAMPMLCAAHPQLLACLVSGALETQSKLNEKAILAQGGAA